MKLYSFYLGQLGAMAKGEADYDAAVATNAAASLNALANLDGSKMWPPGSDNATLGEATRALPAIWATYPAVVEKSKAFKTAAAAMADAALSTAVPDATDRLVTLVEELARGQ